jgi:thioredoxin 1
MNDLDHNGTLSTQSPSATVELTADNFAQVTSLSGIVLVDCWAPWCRNCDEFAESYRKTAEKHPAQTFATLNTQDQKEVRKALGIQHVPALMVYRDGILLFQQPGSYDEKALGDIIAQADGLDMDMVRKELGAENGASRG